MSPRGHGIPKRVHRTKLYILPTYMVTQAKTWKVESGSMCLDRWLGQDRIRRFGSHLNIIKQIPEIELKTDHINS